MSAIRYAAFTLVLGACNELTGPRPRDELASSETVPLAVTPTVEVE